MTFADAAYELGAVGGGAGGVAVERNGVADAVAAAGSIVLAGMRAGGAGCIVDAAVALEAVAVEADQEWLRSGSCR